MILSFYNYFFVILIMMSGLYVVMVSSNLIKKLIGMFIFQVSALLFYISSSFIEGGKMPIEESGTNVVYMNPLPHVLMLTAIVVGLATLCVGLSMIIRIYRR